MAHAAAPHTCTCAAYEVLKDEDTRSKYDSGQLSQDDAHRHRDFSSAAAAAGMGQVQDTPFAWIGIVVSVLAAAVPALYVAAQQASAKGRPKPMSAADAALRALAEDGAGADAAAAADAARDASAAAVKQAAAARRAANRAKAEAAADAQSAVARAAHLAHVADSPKSEHTENTEHGSTGDASLPGGAGGVGTDLTPENLSKLSKALSRYPGGTRGRFDRVAEYMGGGMAACDVAVMVTTLRRRGAGAPPPSGGAPSTGGTPHGGTDAKMEQPWGQSEQQALEAALRHWSQRQKGVEGGVSSDKAARKAAATAKWRWVATQPGLEGRTASQCLARFKHCAQAVS